MSFDRLAWQRAHRKKTGNHSTKKYEKSKRGKVMRTYRNMESRVKGILKKKSHLYEGLDILPRDEFYEWSLGDEDFNRLYEEWVSSGYQRKLSPSIDRLEVSEGYTEGNIRWVTHSENSRLGGKNNG